MACCQDSACASVDSGTANGAPWRRARWIASTVSAGSCVAGIVANAAAGSSARQADSLDFFGDTANGAIGIGADEMAVARLSRTAVARPVANFRAPSFGR